jgi:hypothetical protein
MALITEACPREGHIPDSICTLTVSNRSCSVVCAREERSSSVGRRTGWRVSCFFQLPGNRRRSDLFSSLTLRSVDLLLATDVSGQPICLGLHDPWNETDRLSRNVCSISSYQSTMRNTPEERKFYLHRGEVWHHADDFKSSSPLHHPVIIIVHIFFFLQCNSLNLAQTASMSRFLDHTQTRTQ